MRISLASLLAVLLVSGSCSDDGDAPDPPPDAASADASPGDPCSNQFLEVSANSGPVGNFGGILTPWERGHVRVEHLHIGNNPDGTPITAPLRAQSVLFTHEVAPENPRLYLGPPSPTTTT